MPNRLPIHRCRLFSFTTLRRVLVPAIIFVIVVCLHQAFNIGDTLIERNHRTRSVRSERTGILTSLHRDSEAPDEKTEALEDLPTLLKNLCDFFGVRLVLLDPAMFEPDFVLINQTSISETTLPNNVITFGLFERDHPKFEERSEEYISSTKHNLITTRGIDYRLMKPKKSASITQEITTHYFLFPDPTLSKSALILHIALIFPRQNYFWIADPRESILPPRYRLLNRVHFSIPLPMGVDAFECTKYTLQLNDHQSIDVCVPLDPDFYSWQLQHAKFHECHYEDVVYPFRSKFPDMGQLNSTSDQAEAMAEIMRISKLTRSPILLMCGTLLGWYRQCDYIVESKDIDVGMAAEDYKYQFYKELFLSKILNMVMRIGIYDLGMEYRSFTRKGGVWLDVFLLYQRQPNETSSYLWISKNWYEVVTPNLKGLCSAELFGILVYLPCNYDEFVEADYGRHGWFAPYTGRWYANQNFNWQQKFDDPDEVFLYYGYKKGGCEKPDELWGCDEMPPEVVNSTLYQKHVVDKMANDSMVAKNV